MVDFIGTVLIAGLMMFAVAVFTVFMNISRTAKLVLAGCYGLWIGLCAAAAQAGIIAASKPFPLIGPFIALPLLIAAIAAAFPAGRAALLSIPVPTLIGVHVGRLLAVQFLILEAQDRLGGPFPFFAGWGDIITAVAALPIMWLVASTGLRHRPLIAAWNLFGTLDLVNALALGVTSAENALQLFHTPPGSEAMQHLPFSFVPTVLVPFYLTCHAIIWAHLMQKSRLLGSFSSVRTRAAKG
jgi:hypothetical protein